MVDIRVAIDDGVVVNGFTNKDVGEFISSRVKTAENDDQFGLKLTFADISVTFPKDGLEWIDINFDRGGNIFFYGGAPKHEVAACCVGCHGTKVCGPLGACLACQGSCYCCGQATGCLIMP